MALSRQISLADRRGFLLDAEPDSPAKTSPDPPYHVLKYEPGTDVNHKIRVRAAAGSAAVESAAAASPHLFFEINGDVVRPDRGGDVWSFTLKLNATADVLADLVSKEEWTLYPGGSLFSTYYRTERRGGKVETWFANVTDLSRPPQGRLSRQGSAAHDLDIFKTDAAGRFLYGGTQREGDRLAHYLWAAGKAEQYVRKLRYTGRGRDGALHQAEFVFDSREWEPAGRNSSGLMTYKKTARGAQKAKQTPLRAEPGLTLDDWKNAAGGAPAAAKKPAGGETAKDAGDRIAAKKAAASAERTSEAAAGSEAGSDAKALFKRGEDLLQNRDYWGAADCFRKTVREYPAESNQGLGLCYYAGGLYEAALRHLSEAYRFNPRAPLTVLYLGTTNDNLGRAAEAVRRYEEYLRLAPVDPKMAEFVRSRLQALRGR